jgi:hypothetical protein
MSALYRTVKATNRMIVCATINRIDGLWIIHINKENQIRLNAKKSPSLEIKFARCRDKGLKIRKNKRTVRTALPGL